ncbi:MAG: PucR family transcriptional regulator ligand-binding domain-containing protein [Peptococcaceae bacterium]
MSISLGTVLSLPSGQLLKLVTGNSKLDPEIRRVLFWEFYQDTRCIISCDLVLTNGWGWPDGSRGVQLLKDIKVAGAAALAVELDSFWTAIPEDIAEEAERISLPLLIGQPGISLGMIGDAIQSEIFRRRYDSIEWAESVHRKVTEAAVEARNLSHITSVLSNSLRKSIAVFYRDDKLLTHAAWGKDVDPVRLATIEAEQIPLKVVNRLEHIGVMEILHKATKPFRFQGPTDLGMQERVICPVRLAGEMSVYFTTLSDNEPFSESDMRVMEHGAAVMAMHVLRQQAVAAVEARIHYSLIDALLLGDPNADNFELIERARLSGFDLRINYSVIIVAPQGNEQNILYKPEDSYRQERLIGIVKETLQLFNLPVFVTKSVNRVIFLLPYAAVDDTSKLRKKIEMLYNRIHHLYGQPIMMACGSPHPGMYGIKKSYAEARSAESIHGKTGISLYEDNIVLRILDDANPAIIDDLYSITIGKIQKHPNSEMLMKTLSTLAELDFCQVSAAKTLHLHRNTLLYRISILEKLLGGKLTDPDLKFKIRLALTAKKFRHQR